MVTSLECKIIIDRRRFFSVHRTVGGKEEDRNNYGRIKLRTSLEAETWKNIAEDEHLWRLGIDRRLLAVGLLKNKNK